METTDLKFELILGDCLVELKKLPDNSVDSCVTDPPSGLTVLSSKWDNLDGFAGKTGIRAGFIEFITQVFTEVHRVLKPGAYGLVWAIPKTSGWTSVGLEAAGFDILDCIVHLFSNGYPKHKNALKPASEHWWLIRKQPVGTVVENLEQYGVGDLHVDACKVTPGEYPDGRGRWAPNLLFSHADDCKYLGLTKVQGQKTAERPPDVVSPTGWGHKRQDGLISYPTDADGMETVEKWNCVPGCRVLELEKQSPGISRVFPQLRPDHLFKYQTKSSQEEKNNGTKSLYWKKTSTGYEKVQFDQWVKLGDEEKRIKNEAGDDVQLRAEGNIHISAKPLSLMIWLTKLVTAKSATVLDCFMGSGTTGVACAAAGFSFIGIERDPAYYEIASARIEYMRQSVALLATTPQPKPVPEEHKPVAPATPTAPVANPNLKMSAERLAKLVRKASKS